MEVILFVVDAAGGIGHGDRMIADWLRDISSPVILAANKMDIADRDKARKQIDELKEIGKFDYVIEISALAGTNISALEEKLISYLPEGPKYFPDDMITDQPNGRLWQKLSGKGINLLKEEAPRDRCGD